MRKNLTSILLTLTVLFSLATASAQTVWFDKNWKETTKDNGVYYRPEPKKMKNGYWIVDYYKNGQIQMEGLSLVNKANEEKFDGLVVYYYENGKPFHKANYKEGLLNGVRKIFYKTGELKEIGRYKKGKRQGVWKTYYKNGKIKTRGKYKDNEKVGVWKTFYKNEY